MQRGDLIDVALDRAKADLIIKDGMLVNVNTREIHEANIAIKDGRIAYVGPLSNAIGSKTRVIDAKGRYVVPGLLDGHVHIESSMLTVTEFARVVLPHGTSTVMADFHEIGSILGLKGIKALIDESKRTPLKVYTLVRYLPSDPTQETLATSIPVEELHRFLELKNVLGISEITLKPILDRNNTYLNLIDYALRKGKAIDGSLSGCFGRKLNAAISSGVLSDHETVKSVELIEKLRLGLTVMLREGSTAKNVSDLASTMVDKKICTSNCCLCTDDVHASDLVRKGHMDYVIRRTIKEGIDPLSAIQMATINTAKYFGLDHEIGTISPGRVADILLVEDLEKFVIDTVLINGNVVAEKGRLLKRTPPFKFPVFARKTFKTKMIETEDLTIRTKRDLEHVKVNVIEAFGDQLPTNSMVKELRVEKGVLNPDLYNDVLKLIVVERHRGTGNIGLGFVHGFNLERGALASSVSHDAHNIIAVGTDDATLAFAANTITKMTGGLAAVRESEILASLSLPIAGLISDMPARKVVKMVDDLNEAAKDLGCKMDSPFMTLSFLALPRIPKFRLTDKGLWDASAMRFVDLFVR
ncbi:MAG: adenine deaminase [Candidatus Bathyarchaeota archaeon]|nr:MAG: adenine deaminase [Candidatus Bathyarchaeota archaeon]